MLSTFFLCIACREALSHPAPSPLCEPCASSLVTAPPLCPRCAGLSCPRESCKKPWISHPEIDSYSARYLCIEPGYRILKRWKVTQGPALDRKILIPDARLTQAWRARELDAVTWVPQQRERSWRLGACPAEKIARWVSMQIGVEARSALNPAARLAGQSRQAELRMQERMTHRLRFAWNDESPPLAAGARVLLVDDFMTTGRTLRTAAQVLRSRGAVEVHVFCLGVRPFREGLGSLGNVDSRLGQSQGAGHLDQGAGGAITIRHELDALSG